MLLTGVPKLFSYAFGCCHSSYYKAALNVNLAVDTYDSSLHTKLINNVKDPLREEKKMCGA